ncbi:MAG TPA: flavodoxin domain-containing protein [Myxococcaceae bacterium]|nr:flavodoxin domain-containing protein [Myxococcaceae bacterium]
MARILIVYGTSYGQTQKIAGRIGDRARFRGHQVTLLNAQGIRGPLTLDDCEAVVVGGSVLYGRYQRALERFVSSHRAKLDRLPGTAFFSVSMAAARSTPAAAAEVTKTLDRFFLRTGWHPRAVTSFAGALVYTRYGPILKRVLRFISKRQGGDTDMSRDHEYTDWAAVDAWADAVLPGPVGRIAAAAPLPA